MFADMELIGIPHRLVVGERGLDAGAIEYKGRQDADKQDISLDSVIDFLKEKTARTYIEGYANIAPQFHPLIRPVTRAGNTACDGHSTSAYSHWRQRSEKPDDDLREPAARNDRRSRQF